MMDKRFHPDHVIVSRAKSQLAESDAALSSPLGELGDTLRGQSHPGMPSDVERLIGAAISEALVERNVPIDGVMHGAFDDRTSLVAGPKTLNDLWNLIPYENYIVTARLSPEEIKFVMEEVFTSHEKRNLLGFEVKTQGHGENCRIVSMTLADGRPLDRTQKYVVAFNSFDSRSGGHHFMKLRTLLERPEPNYVLRPVQTRDALIEYFQRHKIVHRIAAGIAVTIAA
jgi:2',3'-cyclic-nucleotide 2'-phosphodiesterase (5'-nucleotidase family)